MRRGVRGILLLAFFVAESLIFKAYGQLSDNEKYDFFDGEYYIEVGEFEKALNKFVVLSSRYPENSNFSYNVGVCYLNLPEQQPKALEYFQNAVKSIDPKYSKGNPRNTSAPPEAWLRLGDAYHSAGNFIEASKAYHEYKDFVVDDKEAVEDVNRRIRGLGISYESSVRPANYVITNMGDVINTGYSDYNPVFSGDQKTLAYTSFRDPRDKIYISYFENNKWSQPEDITTKIGAKGNCYTTALSYSGKELYVVNYDMSNSDIFISKNENGKWSKIKPLSKKINSKYNEGNASLSEDGTQIFFSSDRSGGRGGFDIYVSNLEGNEWSKPENLGEVINTKGNEESPFLASDGKVLYFSSDKHETIGLMDILKSEKDENGNWTPPKNIGVPFNTTEDEIGFVFFDHTKTGYISRSVEDGFGKKDILKIQWVDEELTSTSIEEKPSNETVQQLSENLVEDKKSDNGTIEAESVTESVSEIDNSKMYNMKGDYKNATSPSDYNLKQAVVSGDYYTIQIMALIFPKEKKFFKNIDLAMLKISQGEDGFHRYTYGEFNTYKLASEELKNLAKKGYRNAYIRKTRGISNY